MRPLDGITVVTLEHAIAAPFCTRQLADLGARVIKIERPGSGDFARHYDERVRGLASHFVWTNRSKQSLTLDVKHPQAQDVLAGLLERGGRARAKPRARRRGQAGPLLRGALRQASAAHRVRHFRLWRQWPVPGPKGLRPPDPGRIRLSVDHRHSR